MPTLTMQSIADLTQVLREVVSMWRTRSAGSEHPFPPSLSSRELVFEAGQVAAWLEATGRGNNPDAPLEVLLHSSQFDELLEDLDASSTLLLIHDLVGGPLSALSVDEVLAATAPLDLGGLLPPGRLTDLLMRSGLVRTVDELAEAAFSGRGLLDRLVSCFTRPHGLWAADALTPAGTAMLVELVRGLLEHAHFRIDPHGSGGLLLATALAAELEDHAQPSLGLAEVDAEDPVARAAMRMLAAHAGPDAVGAPDPGTPHLAMLLSQRVEDPHAFFDQIESVLLDLGPQDAAVVVGPSTLLVEAIADEHVREARDRLLLPTAEDPAPLRYAARLPKGLSRFGGRRRLAIWVFGTALPHAGTDWTVYGEHADTPLEPSSYAALTADVAAALTGGTALTAHAFLRSTRMATSALLRRRELVLTPFSRLSRSGGESLARLWELDDGLLEQTLTVQATDEGGTDPTDPSAGRRDVDEAAQLVHTLVGSLREIVTLDWKQIQNADMRRGHIDAVIATTTFLRSPLTEGNTDPEDPEVRPLADSFRSLSSKLDRAWALAAGHQAIQTLLPEVQFYKEVRVWMAKYDAQERLSRGEPVTDEVRRLLGDLLVGSAEAAGVVDIYDEAGLGLQRLDAITPTWIDEAKKPSKSQLAIESLKATILEEVARVTGGNEVRSKLFSQRINELMLKYTNKQLTAAEVIARFVEVAREVRAEADRGARFDPPLGNDELSVFDVVAQNPSAVDVMGHDTLAQIARDLVRIMRQDMRTDWTVRDDVKAKMRSSIKRLLRKYKYPPDQQPEAIVNVMHQMESLAPQYAEQLVKR